MKRSKSYQESLIKSLKDPAEAAAYLNVVLEEGDMRMLLIALRHVVEARGGMVQLSRNAKLNRPNLYKMLSKNGSPSIHTLEIVLGVLGLRLTVSPKSERTMNKAA